MPGQTVEKKGGRTGYRKPDAKRDRISFRMTTVQSEIVEQHRFEGEGDQQLFDRLFSRLAAIEVSPPPAVNHVRSNPRLQTVYCISLSNSTTNLVAENWQGKPQATADYLINWISRLPVTGAIKSPDEALIMLSIFRGRRVELADAMGVLTKQCSELNARQWLLDLIADRSVRAIDVGTGKGVSRRSINGKRVGYIEVPNL